MTRLGSTHTSANCCACLPKKFMIREKLCEPLGLSSIFFCPHKQIFRKNLPTFLFSKIIDFLISHPSRQQKNRTSKIFAGKPLILKTIKSRDQNIEKYFCREVRKSDIWCSLKRKCDNFLNKKLQSYHFYFYFSNTYDFIIDFFSPVPYSLPLFQIFIPIPIYLRRLITF